MDKFLNKKKKKTNFKKNKKLNKQNKYNYSMPIVVIKKCIKIILE